MSKSLTIAGFVIIGVVVAARVGAQSDMSIKPAEKRYGVTTRAVGRGPNGAVGAVNATLGGLVLFAFGLRTYQLAGGPDWINSERFDITTASESRGDQARTDLQNLLITHFKLRFHRETQRMPVYALRTVNNGEGGGRGVWLGVATPSDSGRTLAQFAADLAGSLDRSVFDATNLGGKYDLMPNSTTFPIPVITPPDIGLRLDSQEGAVEMFVIDSASRPENLTTEK